MKNHNIIDNVRCCVLYVFVYAIGRIYVWHFYSYHIYTERIAYTRIPHKSQILWCMKPVYMNESTNSVYIISKKKNKTMYLIFAVTQPIIFILHLNIDVMFYGSTHCHIIHKLLHFTLCYRLFFTCLTVMCNWTVFWKR